MRMKLTMFMMAISMCARMLMMSINRNDNNHQKWKFAGGPPPTKIVGEATPMSISTSSCDSLTSRYVGAPWASFLITFRSSSWNHASFMFEGRQLLYFQSPQRNSHDVIVTKRTSSLVVLYSRPSSHSLTHRAGGHRNSLLWNTFTGK